MESAEVILSVIIGLAVWSFILSSIISASSRSKKIELLLKKQMILLAKLAHKQGIDKDEINAILNQVQ